MKIAIALAGLTLVSCGYQKVTERIGNRTETRIEKTGAPASDLWMYTPEHPVVSLPPDAVAALDTEGGITPEWDVAISMRNRSGWVVHAAEVEVTRPGGIPKIYTPMASRFPGLSAVRPGESASLTGHIDRHFHCGPAVSDCQLNMRLIGARGWRAQ